MGFIWGYICQQYIQTVYVLGAGVLLASLVSPTFSWTHHVLITCITLLIDAAGDPSLAYIQEKSFELAKIARSEVLGTQR